MQHERETGNCISLVCLRPAKLCALSNPYLNDMQTLPTVMPEVYDAFQTFRRKMPLIHFLFYGDAHQMQPLPSLIH